MKPEFYNAADSFSTAGDTSPEFATDAIDDSAPEDHFELKPDAYVKVADVERVIAHWCHENDEPSTGLIGAIYDIEDSEDVMPASKVQVAIRYIMGLLIESNDTRLEAKVIAYSVGLTFKGGTETEIAREHGISKQAFSKRVREFQNRHGLTSSLGNKRAGTREGYRLGNSRRTAI